MIDTAGHVFERPLMLEVPFYMNAYPLDADDCLMHRQATFFAAFIGFLGGDISEYAKFKFPSVNPMYGDSMMGGATYAAALSARREFEKLTTFMLSPSLAKQQVPPADHGYCPTRALTNPTTPPIWFVPGPTPFGHQSRPICSGLMVPT